MLQVGATGREGWMDVNYVSVLDTYCEERLMMKMSLVAQ
jgi:hypothetical protein